MTDDTTAANVETQRADGSRRVVWFANHTTQCERCSARVVLVVTATSRYLYVDETPDAAGTVLISPRGRNGQAVPHAYPVPLFERERGDHQGRLRSIHKDTCTAITRKVPR